MAHDTVNIDLVACTRFLGRVSAAAAIADLQWARHMPVVVLRHLPLACTGIHIHQDCLRGELLSRQGAVTHWKVAASHRGPLLRAMARAKDGRPSRRVHRSLMLRWMVRTKRKPRKICVFVVIVMYNL